MPLEKVRVVCQYMGGGFGNKNQCQDSDLMAAELAKMPLLNQHLKEDRYIGWNGLRGNPQANFLALVLPRFLLRFAYGADNQVRRFGFVEMANDQPAETEAEGLLWGNGALAVGINMAHSFTETGWATRLTGVGGSGRVADLPLWRCRGPGGEARVPLEVVLPQSKQGELYEAGFAVLGCRPNEDVAHLAFAPTVYQPIAYKDDESTAAARLPLSQSLAPFGARCRRARAACVPPPHRHGNP